MAISSSSSSSSSDNEVQNCSKQCLESFKIHQKNFDSEREKHSRARLEIQGYELALESLESRILGHEKNELAWGEKYEFQNYKLKCREIKINNLNTELEKVVKERDELKLKIEKWERSSKNLTKILNSQMSAHDKNGLGFGTKMDELSNKSETDSDISMTVFEVRSSNEELTPANDRFSKANGYHAIPPPITGNFLTPRADISFAGLDEYSIRKKIIKSKTDTSKSKTSETVDDEDDVSEVSPVKTNETQTAKTQVDKIGQTSKKAGIGFKKIKACFVCKSTDHLIKDCDFYDKKSPELKLQNMVNTGQRMVKPVWDNAKRVNHQNFSNKLNYPQARRTFVLSGVLTRTGLVNPVRPNRQRAVPTVSTARPISTARPVSTARPFTPKIAQSSSAIRPIYPRMDNVRPRASYSPIKRSYYTKPAFRPKDLKQDVQISGVQNMTTAGIRAVVNTGKGKMDTDLKKSRWVWRPKGNYLDHVSKDSGSFMLKKFEYGNPEILLQDHAVVDSGCSSHMTGNKAYLSDYEDYNGGFVAFGSDPKRECLHEEKIGKEEVLEEKVNAEGMMQCMETEDAQDEGRTSSKTLELSLSGDTVVLEEKESKEKGVSIEDPVNESATSTMTSTPTQTVFGDDETIAQVLITMSQNKVKQKEKEKGVEIKDTEDADRPRTKIERSILTLKPLPKIDPKAKGKKKIEEEDEFDTESEDIT
ncbi:hypothetical protein Tco_1028857 [Tanacetum coccineum]|uniref:Retrovirus-related Pol polyprotein from transposon TNT 1-94-like beta-barrel domain-containing protein n=1 Tax=Tanacetum coccineum TaxID=301880 RepID=A0ABQ5G1S1_9ASTR